MKSQKLVERSKDILGGTPVFRGTRVPVQTFIDYLEDGKTIVDFVEDFPTVKREQATQLLEVFKKDLLEDKHESAA